VELREGVRRAIISGNLLRGKVRIDNRSSGNVIIRDNVSEEKTP
jgi:hypothetical protein